MADMISGTIRISKDVLDQVENFLSDGHEYRKPNIRKFFEDAAIEKLSKLEKAKGELKTVTK